MVRVDDQDLVAFTASESEQLLWLVEQRLPALEKLVQLQRETIELQKRLVSLKTATASTALDGMRTEHERADMWKNTAQDLRMLQPGLGSEVLDALRWLLAGVAVYAIVNEVRN